MLSQIPAAFPVRSEINEAISVHLNEMQSHGTLGKILSAATTQKTPNCPASSALSSTAALEVPNMASVFIVYAFAFVLSLVGHSLVGRGTWRMWAMSCAALKPSTHKPSRSCKPRTRDPDGSEAAAGAPNGVELGAPPLDTFDTLLSSLTQLMQNQFDMLEAKLEAKIIPKLEHMEHQLHMSGTHPLGLRVPAQGAALAESVFPSRRQSHRNETLMRSATVAREAPQPAPPPPYLPSVRHEGERPSGTGVLCPRCSRRGILPVQ
jgi:hypothetical protein